MRISSILKRLSLLGAALIILIMVIMMYPVLPPNPREAHVATRLGLHVTQEELDIWRQRRTDTVNGINGVSYAIMWNSEILGKANTFRSAPTTGTWNPTTGEYGSWTGSTNFPDNKDGSNNTYSPGGSGCCSAGNVDRVSDAAFVYLVIGDASYGNLVRTWLLNHANNPSLNFNNTTAWPRNVNYDGVLIRVGK